MSKSIIELVIGNLDEKREYKKYTKRVNALPKDYRFAFKKIRNYMYYTDLSGCEMSLFTDLVELFEASAAAGKPVLSITGTDVAVFCDELMRAASADKSTTREKLNMEIHEHFKDYLSKEGK